MVSPINRNYNITNRFRVLAVSAKTASVSEPEISMLQFKTNTTSQIKHTIT
jgi:hypothetical protein